MTTTTTLIDKTDAGCRVLLLDGDNDQWEYLEIVLRDDGTITLEKEWRHQSDNGTSPKRWHGAELAWTIATAQGGSVAVDLDRLRADLTDSPLRRSLDTIAAGFSVDWDGSNYSGTLTDAASAEVESLDAGEYAGEWTTDDTVCSAHEFLTGHGNDSLAGVARDAGITAATTDAELDALALSLDPVGNVILTTSLREELDAVREAAAEEAEEAEAEAEAEEEVGGLSQ